MTFKNMEKIFTQGNCEKRDLALEREDLGKRLYYCSNTGEGRKVRRELKTRIRKINKLIGN